MGIMIYTSVGILTPPLLYPPCFDSFPLLCSFLFGNTLAFYLNEVGFTHWKSGFLVCFYFYQIPIYIYFDSPPLYFLYFHQIPI